MMVVDPEAAMSTVKGTWMSPSNSTLYDGGTVASTVDNALLNTAASGLPGIMTEAGELVERRVAQILRLASSKDWDSYGGTPVTAEWGITVASWLVQVAGAVRRAPAIFPTPSGGLRAAWEFSHGFIEVSFEPLATPLVETEIDGTEAAWPLRGNAELMRFMEMLSRLNSQ